MEYQPWPPHCSTLFYLNAGNAGVGHLKAIEGLVRYVEHMPDDGAHHAGVANEQYVPTGMPLQYIIPCLDNAPAKDIERLGARGSLAERISLESSHAFGVISGQLARGTAFPHTKADLDEAWFAL